MKFGATLAALAATAGVLLGATGAIAQAYPTKPITWVVPFTPGGITDSGARIIAKALSERIGQPVLVENRPGAGGVVGTEYVAKIEAGRLHHGVRHGGHDRDQSRPLQDDVVRHAQGSDRRPRHGRFAAGAGCES